MNSIYSISILVLCIILFSLEVINLFKEQYAVFEIKDKIIRSDAKVEVNVRSDQT